MGTGAGQAPCPFTFSVRRSANDLKAETLIGAGHRLRIVASAELRGQLTAGQAAVVAI